MAALLMSSMSLPVMADSLGDATLKWPESNVYLEIPGSVEIEWPNQIVTLVNSETNDYGDEYAMVNVSIDEGAPVEVAAYYIYSPRFEMDGVVYFEEECYLNIALYEMEQDYDDAVSISIEIPAGLVKNEAGDENPAQTITLTRSPYADAPYYFDMTWTPEDGSVISQNEAIVKISCDGNPIQYLIGEISLNNYDLWEFGSLEFGNQVTINADNELVIDLTNEAPGEVEIYIPAGYLLVEVDGENYLSGSLILEYWIEEAETDAIDSINTDNTPRRIYTLQGVRVDSNSRPAPGIYIINGKKVAIK